MKYPVIWGDTLKTSVSKSSGSITSHSITSSNDSIIVDNETNKNLIIVEE